MRSAFIAIGSLLALAACDAKESERPAAPSFAAAAAAGPALAAEGERLSALLGCSGCHGADLQGDVWDEEPEFGVLSPSNLTRVAARSSDAELERAIREGVRADGSALWEMPSDAFTDLSAHDMAALIAFLRSHPPAGPERARPVFGAGARKEVESGALRSAPDHVAEGRGKVTPDPGPGHELGRYIARTVCGECHGLDLAGKAEPFRPDLVVAGAYTLPEFTRLMRTGQPTGERELGLMAEVARTRFSRLRDDEIAALHAYLKAAAELPR